MPENSYVNTRTSIVKLLRERLASGKIRSMEMKQLLELEREIENEAEMHPPATLPGEKLPFAEEPSEDIE